jgi:hypothetical protein
MGTKGPLIADNYLGNICVLHEKSTGMVQCQWWQSALSDGAAIQRALVGCRDENHPKENTRHGKQDRGFAH